MLTALFEIGTWAFWTVTGLLFIFTCTFVEDFERDGWNEANFGWPFFLNILIIAFLWRSHFILGLSTEQIVGWSVSYLFAGIAWSFFKWNKFVKYKYKHYLDVVDAAKAGFKNKSERYAKSAKEGTTVIQVGEDLLPDVNLYRPVASKEKDQLSSWILFWPYSVVRYIFANLLGDIMLELIKRLGGVYETITNAKFKEQKY